MAARECYLAMMALDEQVQTLSIEERRVVAEPIEVLENVLLQENDPEKFTRIGTGIKEKAREDLIQFLRKSIDVFAWSHDDMPGIDPSVITHQLNVYPFFKQKTAYEIMPSLVGSEMCIRDRMVGRRYRLPTVQGWSSDNGIVRR